MRRLAAGDAAPLTKPNKLLIFYEVNIKRVGLCIVFASIYCIIRLAHGAFIIACILFY